MTIGEVPVSTTSSDVHDEVELLVERCIDFALVFPRVVTVGPATFLPEALGGGVDIEHNVIWGVEVGGDAVLGPNETVDVEIISKGCGMGILLGGLLVTICVPCGTPVEGRAELVVATSRARGAVTARLHNVNLTRGGPATVCFVDGKQPDGGPEPVTLGQLSLDLNLAVLERELVGGADAGGLDGVDHVARGGSVALTAVESV